MGFSYLKVWFKHPYFEMRAHERKLAIKVIGFSQVVVVVQLILATALYGLQLIELMELAIHKVLDWIYEIHT
jgi:hypothetical protein